MDKMPKWKLINTRGLSDSKLIRYESSSHYTPLKTQQSKQLLSQKKLKTNTPLVLTSKNGKVNEFINNK